MEILHLLRIYIWKINIFIALRSFFARKKTQIIFNFTWSNAKILKLIWHPFSIVSGYFGMPCGAKKNLGRVEKFEKTRFFQYFYWRILEIYWNLKFWKKLSHKNAIKMIWGVLFFIAKQKNISNCGSFDQNCGSFLTRFWGYFLALFDSESGALWFKTFSQFVGLF